MTYLRQLWCCIWYGVLSYDFGADRLHVGYFTGNDETLRDLLAEIRSAGSMQTLADLAEAIHQLNHVLCDALEQIPALDHP